MGKLGVHHGRARKAHHHLPALAIALAVALVTAVAGPAASVGSAPEPRGAGGTGAQAGPAADATYQPIEPYRMVDTRDGINGPVGPGQEFTLPVGAPGLPDGPIQTVALNVTLVNPTLDTHLTVWPHGSPLPPTSNLNAPAGAVVANFALVAVGDSRAIRVRNESGYTDVLIDIVGYFEGEVGGRIRPAIPTRVVDTRIGLGLPVAMMPASTSTVDLSDVDGVPSGPGSAALVNITGVMPTVDTHLTVSPNWMELPLTSNVNIPAGTNVANLALVPLSAEGYINIFNNAGTTNVVIDVVGWLDGSSIPPIPPIEEGLATDDPGVSNGGGFTSVPPARIADAREVGSSFPLLGGGEAADVAVTGVGGVPASGVAAVALTITAVASDSPTHLTAWPAGTPLPGTSSLNLNAGEVRAATVIVGVGADGKVSVRNQSGVAAVIVDVVGYVHGIELPPEVVTTADRCDPIAPSLCMLPFPNDWYTVADPTTDTGRRVSFHPESMPANAGGVRIDPTEWNRNDGFSPGSSILAHLPTVDLAASGAAPVTDIAQSLLPDAPIVVLDAETGERYPYWAELDMQATDPAKRLLIVQPATALAEGHRIIVGLRNLVEVGGAELAPTDGFRAMRDGIITNAPAFEARRPRFEEIFADLDDAGVARHDLTLAWAFTVSSERSLSERMLHIRDDSFAELGDAAPEFTVAAVENNVNSTIARRVTGTVSVPNYMTGDGSKGQRFNYGDDGLPERNGTFAASFQCNIPYSVLGAGGGADPGPVSLARPVVYGHGLLGNFSEINAGNVGAMANEHTMIFCATRWIGMSNEDIPNVGALQDASNFPKVADRLQQGMLNTLWLGRVMRHAGGLTSHPAFQGAAAEPLIDRTELFYDGNSQGGIMGAAVTAVSQEWTRAVLGVPGQSYVLLLPRSVDFVTFQIVYNGAYPDELSRILVLDLIQMLWDRGEAMGYAQHLTKDPYPSTPNHTVLLHEAYADFQVANVATEMQARTIGANVHQPALASGRHTDVTPMWGIDPIPAFPYDGSALIVWDSGTPAVPTANLPPTDGEDPHSDPRSTLAARVQKSAFLQTNGMVIDVCAGAPCLTS